jgi:nucleotide-binding universal stress UspA family protein
MQYFHNIVVAVDFSRTSAEAWHVARQVASAQGARLHLLHVVADVRHTPAILEAPGAGFDDIQRQWVRDAEARLAELAASGAGAVDSCQALVGSPVAATIVEYAAAHQADLIVVGTHGYGPLKRLLLGSVCDQLLRSASCPVLTVPPVEAPTAAAESLAKAGSVES